MLAQVSRLDSPLLNPAQVVDEGHLGFEDVTEELDVVYGNITREGAMTADPNGEEILEGKVYSFAELANIEKGAAPVPYNEEIVVTDVHKFVEHEGWSVEELLQ